MRGDWSGQQLDGGQPPGTPPLVQQSEKFLHHAPTEEQDRVVADLLYAGRDATVGEIVQMAKKGQQKVHFTRHVDEARWCQVSQHR